MRQEDESGRPGVRRELRTFGAMAQWVIGALGIFQFAGKTEEGHVHHCPLRLFGIPARLLTSVHSTNQFEAVQPHSMCRCSVYIKILLASKVYRVCSLITPESGIQVYSESSELAVSSRRAVVLVAMYCAPPQVECES